MTEQEFDERLAFIENSHPTQDLLQWADDQVLMNMIKNVYQPNQEWLIEQLKRKDEALIRAQHGLDEIAFRMGSHELENCSKYEARKALEEIEKLEGNDNG